MKTIFEWTLNVPLDRKKNSRRTANFIKADDELSRQFTRFCKQEFSDSEKDKDAVLFKEDSHAIGIVDMVELKFVVGSN